MEAVPGGSKFKVNSSHSKANTAKSTVDSGSTPQVYVNKIYTGNASYGGFGNVGSKREALKLKETDQS